MRYEDILYEKKENKLVKGRQEKCELEGDRIHAKIQRNEY